MMTNKVELVGNDSEEVNPEEETQPTQRSEMCIGWNNTTQPNNITTGVTIRITQSMTNDKAQLVTNTAPILNVTVSPLLCKLNRTKDS